MIFSEIKIKTYNLEICFFFLWFGSGSSKNPKIDDDVDSESFSLCEFNVETISLNYTHNLDNCLIYFYKTNESHKLQYNSIFSFIIYIYSIQ